MRGQFKGYREEDGVAKNSTVETFAAVRLHIDSWRWSGVQFLVRAGKRMPTTATEVLVELRRPPQIVFDEPKPGDPNSLRFALSPDVAIALRARVKVAGEELKGEDVELLSHRRHPKDVPPYERLLGDAMRGDPTFFAREDGVQAAWKVVDPILDDATPVHPYAQGSWGPEQADALLPAGQSWVPVQA